MHYLKSQLSLLMKLNNKYNDNRLGLAVFGGFPSFLSIILYFPVAVGLL